MDRHRTGEIWSYVTGPSGDSSDMEHLYFVVRHGRVTDVAIGLTDRDLG